MRINIKHQMPISLLLLAGLTILAFYPCLSFDFLLNWDDSWQVFNDFTHNGITVANLAKTFSTPYMGQYSPFNQLIYSCIYHLWGMNAFVFHLVNLCLHIGCVLLTFTFIRNLLILYGEESTYKLNLIPFITAACMAVHPLQVESVVWISASKVLWCSFFFLCGINMYLKYCMKPTALRYIIIILMFICSFLSKEQAVVFPLCLLLIDWTIKKRDNWKYLILEKTPLLLLALLFCIVTLISYGSSVSEVIDNGFYSVDQRFAFMGYSLTEYVTKLILPINLMYMYPFPIQPGEVLPFRFYMNILSIAAFIYFLWLGRKHKIFVFGSLFFIIHLILVLHIISMPRATITADRYVYLACIGFFFPIIYYGVDFISRHKPYRKLILGLSILLISSWGIYSNLHSHKWENGQTLKIEMKDILDLRKD